METAVPEIQEPIPIVLPESPKAVEAEGKEILKRAEMFVVTSDNYETAGETRAKLIAEADKRSAMLEPAIEKAHAAHTALTNIRKWWITCLYDAAKVIKSKMIDVNEAEKRKAEKKRLELEAAEKKKAEQEALEIAVLLEAAGQKEEAEAVLSEPVQVSPVAVKPDVPKIERFSYRTQYSVKVTDLKTLARAAVAGLVPIQAIQANEVFLNQQARNLKEALSYPGVELVKPKV